MFNNCINSIKPKFLLLLFITLLFIYGFGSSFLYRTFGLTGYIIGRFLFALACYFWFIHFHKGNHLLTEAHPFFQTPAFSLIFLLIFVDLYMIHLFDVPGNITALLKQDISSILCDTFIALTAGIFEETIFRGIGADTFCAWYKETNHPLCHSAIWTSLIFGLSHLSNMNGTDSSQVWI